MASQLKVNNSGGLMLVCKWASVNDIVQNNFRSIIHLLSEQPFTRSKPPTGTPDECARSVKT